MKCLMMTMNIFPKIRKKKEDENNKNELTDKKEKNIKDTIN